MGIFPDAKGQLTHKSLIGYCPTVLNFMGVLVACKNEEDPIKNEGSRVVTTLFIDFSHPQGQLTNVLVTYKDEENQMKNEGTRVVETLYSYILDAQGQLTL